MVRPLMIAALGACTIAAPPGSSAPSGDAPLDTPPGLSNVTLSLTFDDTLSDQYQVGAMLESHGLLGTFFINSPRVGQASYMTLAQVQDLLAHGNEIAGHTLDHVHLTQLDPATARHEICDDRTALVTMGFDVTSFAYPFGDSNASVEQIVHDCGYASGRSIGGLFTADTCTSCPYTNQMPPLDRYDIRTPASVAGAVTVDGLEAYIEDAERHGGGWLPFVFHHVCDACSTNAVSPTVLEQFFARIQARGIRVRTVGQIMGGS